MIIQCPNCESDYDILQTALGEDGRDVKCAKCGHLWFCGPDGKEGKPAPKEETEVEETVESEDDVVEEAQEDVSAAEDDSKETAPTVEENEEDIDIPEGIKPISEDEMKDMPPPQTLAAKMAGYGAALVFFGLLIVGSLVFKNTIIQAWPPSALFYQMAGMPAQLKGEGLIVESLSATILKNKEQKDVLVVKGRVVNFTPSPVDVPKMQAILRSTNGEDGETWIIDPPVEVIAAGQSFAFTSKYPEVPGGIGSVNLALVPTLSE